MANYPQRKKKPEEMGSADDGAAYVKKKGRAERDWAEDAAVKTEDRGVAAMQERMKDTRYYRKGGKVKKYAEGGQPKSSRTKMLEEQPKNFMQEMAAKVSRGLDKIGITQEKEYKDKSKEELSVKKAKGGKISEYGGMEKYASKAAMKKHEKAEGPSEEKLEKKMGKGMARADMQKVAGKAVKGHEKRMHGMACGGSAKKYAKGGSIDGCATKGKTKGRMV